MILNSVGATIVTNDANLNSKKAFTPSSQLPESFSKDIVSDAQDIVLPNHFSNHTYVAIDIGGTLAKVVYYKSNSEQDCSGGRLNFAKFQTEDLDRCIDFLKFIMAPRASATGPAPPLAATGGGAHKFLAKLREAAAPREVVVLDEMECLISGVDYLISQVPNEVFHYSPNPTNPLDHMQFVPSPAPAEKYPYLLVNIGSGVSIIKVTAPGEFERVSGTSLGGGTFLGLASLLTGEGKSFDEILELSKRGQNSSVDMFVGDIYGQDYNKIGLKATAIASSMGKINRKDLREPASDSKDSSSPVYASEDLCSSLLFAISNNIGQIAFLNACRYNVKHIYFGGFFIRGHPVTMQTLQYAIKFWSEGKMNARFLRHEGYLGSMGCLLNLNTTNN
ncbi:hypothetical protein DSO57_1024739 [Entomophthora muscae]|uniref:Uncharacterized protein n=1 Tax=Entomophthora muscae TaxID=34485 RepID=A0ACC2UNC0_9FUNG|nr:hypothetical protein DSO57_1024739 [Entomophthora muscae]